MSKDQPDLAHAVSDGGIAANHPVVQEQGALVGPATGSEFNTIKAGIIPIACWRLEDIRFEFDSSVVRPEVTTELDSLVKLIRQHPPLSRAEKSQPPQLGCPLSVFGHADPTGNDDYNKQLSGRRAKAIYALLTRRTELWEELFSQPLGNDKWGRRALEMMLGSVASAPEAQSEAKSPPSSQSSAAPVKPTEESVSQHERDAGKRKALFLAYMDNLCGPELKLEKTDFLGHGDDAGGKADFQGCSEFNPVLIVSQEEQDTFEHDKDHKARNSANASNRRVMVLIFRKGSRVAPAKWPCPRTTEGVAGCRKRFWSDGEKRRSRREPDERRLFEAEQDTFACRFYHRMAADSPCESVKPLSHISLLLRSNSGAAPIVNAKYKIHVGRGRVLDGTTDKDGFLRHAGIAPGDYKMDIEGFDGDILVPTLPLHLERRITRIAGFFLLAESLASEPPTELDPDQTGPRLAQRAPDELEPPEPLT